MWFNRSMNAFVPTLSFTLQQARKACRLSQLELSMRVGVSQRHISYVESGRAKPSRELLRTWLQELNMPLIACNEALLLAGYAPEYSDKALHDPTMAQANDALLHLLKAHDPMPAFVIDADWNLLHANRGAKWLIATLLPSWTSNLPNNTRMNMLDALCHPDGLVNRITNLNDIASSLVAHMRNEAAVRPSIIAKVELFSKLLENKCGKEKPAPRLPASNIPVLTTRFSSQYGELAFFSMFTTFGTPHDITLASLRVEHMFSADTKTHEVLRLHIPSE
jgi:transcriptional regulator with XRE-family HTH domain